MAPEPDRMKARRATPGFARRRLAPEDPDGQSVGGQPGGGIDEPARRVDERPPADAVAPGRDAMVAPGGGASARPIPVSRRERPSTSVSPVDPGWEPPLDEPLQLVSVRLPASLARALDSPRPALARPRAAQCGAAARA